MPCKPKIEKNILNEKLIEERCELYCRTLIARIEEIEKKLETKCDAHEIQDIIRKEIGTDKGRSPQVTPSDNAKESRGVLRETINEIQDRKARESSFLICNAPEPDTNLKEIRGLKDKELVQGLGGIFDVNIKLHDINEVIRLGKKPTQDGKPRPLKVIMKEPESKVRLFKKLWKLRDATDNYKGLSIQNQNDLTKKEREEEKKLLDEARANEALDGGKTRFRVRGPPWARRIVRMKPHGYE